MGETPLRSYLQSSGVSWVLRLDDWLRSVDWTPFTSTYDGRGRQPIHPRILLGLTLYGLFRRQSSLRELESLAQTDVGAWWLCGGLQPDHSTIGKFLQQHDATLSGPFFLEMTKHIVRKLKVKTGEAGGDGTVIEAVASRYRLLSAQVALEAAEAARAAAQEHPSDAKASAAADRLEMAARIASEREAAAREQRRPDGRVKVNPTEPEAVVQPRKDGARRPSYRPSVLANTQRLILGQHVEGGDEIASVAPMLAQHREIFDAPPTRLSLDANYLSERILNLAMENDLDLLCPSGKADRGQWEKASSATRFDKAVFEYDEDADRYTCPAGQTLRPLGGGNDHGHEYRRYGDAPCGDCALRALCTTSKDGRTIKRYAVDPAKEAMKKVMAQPGARRAYRKRKAMVEPVFAELRERQGLTRFRRRGLVGARLEFALHACAHNLKRAIAMETAAAKFVAEAAKNARLRNRLTTVAAILITAAAQNRKSAHIAATNAISALRSI
ncbi:IS1182 family transposase [bacterium]|nr:IS1182 family transposase [bacterium]